MTDHGRSALFAARDPRLKWAVLISLGAHALILGGALWVGSVRAAPRLDRSQKPIMAKLVRLGEPRDAKLLPRKYKTPPPPKPSAVLPVELPEEKPQPEPEKKPEPKPEPPKPTTPERSKDPLAEAMRRLGEIDADARPSDEALPGAPDGDPYGDADEAGEGDRYLALIQRAVRDNYKVPSIISDRERQYLNAVVTLHVAPDGEILKRRIDRSSGNVHFDNALLRAVDASNPLPPPPAAWRERFRREGLDLHFRP